MKIYLCVSFIITSLFCYSQTVTKYYDADWLQTTHDKAIFYAEYIKDGNVFQCTSRWVAGNALRGRSTLPDTVLQNPIGLQLLYFKNGRVEDSTFYADGKAKFFLHYYPNNQLSVHYYLPDNQKDAVIEGYNEDGKKINHYIFEREAEFRGGEKAWANYLSKAASKELTVKGEGTVTASVQIEFLIDGDGNVIKPKILKPSGFKEVDKDALRVIAESPLWNCAIQYNKPVKAYRVQPMSYTLIDQKK